MALAEIVLLPAWAHSSHLECKKNSMGSERRVAAPVPALHSPGSALWDDKLLVKLSRIRSCHVLLCSQQQLNTCCNTVCMSVVGVSVSWLTLQSAAKMRLWRIGLWQFGTTQLHRSSTRMCTAA